MATIKSKYSGSKIAVLIAFFVPLLGGFLFNREWLGLLIGFITGLAVWRALGGKADDLKD